MRFGDLTVEEIRAQARAGALAVVPTGCTEQQGPHLPVDFDTWFAETLCLAAARQVQQVGGAPVLVLPAMPFGPTPEHRNFGSGYVHIPQQTFEELVEAVLVSLREQGFRRLVLWRGCGGHRLASVVARLNEQWAGQARVFLPAQPFHAIWCRIGNAEVPGGHADSFATSIALYLRPEAVRPERIPAPVLTPVNWEDPDLDFARISPTGVIGDPTHASAELGARLWPALVEAVASIFQEVAESTL